ncbi:MAG: L-Lysine--8-amino-7-oxononanoate transaminase [Verrucomicrobia subdivision 3 bacterium]|nr:L-Lysine--8-amino-7-oxononanoate transaminase [Limisphaerales bacterium]MCS1412930.1 L-Lysine--8-amino-7-oxononanoate transaminase [Limisphaerales bacterium]
MPHRTQRKSDKNPAQLDRQYIWHPFTQMQEWIRTDPIVITSGKGAILTDQWGRKYIDANASIWTNLHGHNHPVINRAIHAQLVKISHSSALGLANEPASYLAADLIQMAKLNRKRPRASDSSKKPPPPRQPELTKVFFSDDGSTAMEVALKLHFEHQRRTTPKITPRYLSLENSYHGDTVGAMSLSHSPLFHQSFRKIRFKVDRIMAPYCYRCPYNQAQAKRTDARSSRQCRWECVQQIKERIETAKRKKQPYTAFVVEPIIQGAAGMIAHPKGWLTKVARLIQKYRMQLIADEVMTGFGRTGPLIASHGEGIQPDFLALAKGMTGGYLPMAATLTTQAVFDSFLGPYDSFRTFFHGHSFTGNQLGSAAALANLKLLQSPRSTQQRKHLEDWLENALDRLWRHPQVGDIRQAGLVAGIELVKKWQTREPFPLKEQAGIRVCQALAKRGVLTRPIGNVIVIMLIYTMTKRQVDTIVAALSESIKEALPL